MKPPEHQKIVDACYRSRKGIATNADIRFCEKMYHKVPDQYAAASKEGRKMADDEVNPFT